MNSIMHASEPFTTKEFFALDVDEKLKVELIGGPLAVSPPSKPWHGDVALELRDALKATLGPRFRIYLGLDVRIDEENVPRPDVFVVLSQPSKRDRVTEAADVLCGRRDHVAGLESERPPSQAMALPRGRHPVMAHRAQRRKRSSSSKSRSWRSEQTHLGQVTLKVADFDVPIDLDAIARYAFGE